MWINLGKVMDEKEVSQRQLATALGRQPSEVSRFFKPEFDPKISLLLQISDVLGVELMELFDPNLNQADGVVVRPATARKALGIKEQKPIRVNKKVAKKK